MCRTPVVFLFLWLSPFLAPAQPHGYYYGKLVYPRQHFDLVLHFEDSALFVVGLRPNAIPLKDYRFDGASISFGRADFYSEFHGDYDVRKDLFRGKWTDEDLKLKPLEFVPVNPDTLRGFRALTKVSRQYSVPRPEEGIPVCHASEAKVNVGVLDGFLDRVDRGDFGYIHSLLISRNGCLVYENYFYNFHGEMTFGIQSVTKSFVSALAGIAIARGEIPGVSEPLAPWIDKPYRPLVTDELKSLTLHRIMSMTTGLEWNETAYDYGDERNNLTQASQQDPFRFLLKRRLLPERPFMYNSVNHSMMNMVLRNATGLSNEKEIARRLLEPLNISTYDLGERDSRGLIGDIFLRPRDMLKFGSLYLNRGRFNETQIIPSAWVDTSTRTKVVVKENLGYGYFWWTTTFRRDGREVNSYFAWGYGGQYIFIVPEVGLVVVMNGTNWHTDPERYASEIMRDYILPACE